METKSGRAGSEDRWSKFARYTIAIVWGLSGLAAALGAPGTIKAGVLLIPVALAFNFRPAVLRWPMFSFVVLAPVVFLGLAHEYFHTITNYPYIIWACVGIIAHSLLLFGRMTPPRVAVG